MSKTTPVRWWRDDADRYRPRHAARPEMPHQLRIIGIGGWAWHMKIRDQEPELGAVVDKMQEIICGEDLTIMRPTTWEPSVPPDPAKDIEITVRGWYDAVKWPPWWHLMDGV